MPPAYCHVVDVLRKFNPQLTESNLDNDEYIGNEDREQVRARIDAVGSMFESRTGNALRTVRRGSPGTPETYELHDAKTRGWRDPITVDLDHRQVHPFDPAEGDALEIRDGRDSWEDVTAEAGDTFTLESNAGRLQLFRILVNRIWWEDQRNRFLRASYRYGGLGGTRSEGGQTTLSSGPSDTATTLDVDNAGRLVEGVALIDDSEYVRITDIDYQNDQLTVERGIRATTASSHDADVTIHYCPTSVRDAVAAKTAAELVRYDDWVDELVDGDNAPSPNDKIDGWDSEFDQTCAKHSGVRRM